MSELVKYDTDDLIYNRYDLIHSDNVKEYTYEKDEKIYKIQVYFHEGIAEPNIWGKRFPQDVFENFVEDVFKDKDIYAIKVTRGRNQYKKFLQDTIDIRVPLPDNMDDLMNRIARKKRATIRRNLRWLDERIGDLRIDSYERKDIPDDIVNTYFVWKKATRGTNYGLTAQEYLDKYYVTNAMMMRAGNVDVAVAFYCKVNEQVFFENFSYNPELSRYSPGLLMYVKFMEELIQKGCKYNYMGGGNYIYKQRFGSETEAAYIGTIYRKEIVNEINKLFEEHNIENVAFYGFGVCGHDFLQCSKNIKINVDFGIDMNAESTEGLKIYRPEDELPEMDAVLITLNNKNTDVENILEKKFLKVYYWNDIVKEAAEKSRQN